MPRVLPAPLETISFFSTPTIDVEPKKVVANHEKFATTGTAEGIRTPDLLVRSQSLYPTELQPHFPRFTHRSVERYASITQEK